MLELMGRKILKKRKRESGKEQKQVNGCKGETLRMVLQTAAGNTQTGIIGLIIGNNGDIEQIKIVDAFLQTAIAKDNLMIGVVLRTIGRNGRVTGVIDAKERSKVLQSHPEGEYLIWNPRKKKKFV